MRIASRIRENGIVALLVVMLFASSAIAAYGASYYLDYAASQRPSTQIRLGTVLAFDYNSSDIANLGFHMLVDIPNKIITVIWDWNSALPGDYGFAAALPVTLTGPQNGTGGWYYHNVAGNGSWVSTELVVTTKSVTSEVFQRFGVQDDLVSGDHGSYSFYLPMGEDLPMGLSESLRGLNTHLPDPRLSYRPFTGVVTVSVGTPQNDSPALIYPPNALPTSSHYEVGAPEQNYFWSFASLQAVILNYQDNGLIGRYQNDLFWGGLLLGVGISLIPGIFLEIVRTKFEKR